MSAGAQPLRVTARDRFPLAQIAVEVLQAEGAVQLCWLSEGWPEGPRRVAANVFAGPETAEQLRAIARHLESLEWGWE